MSDKNIETFYPKNRKDWRKWLAENHQSQVAVWLLFYKKSSDKPSLSWSEAVDEALCFGWIDSKKVTRDKESYLQYFSPRKAKSIWSKINKDKIEKLIEEGLMKKAGLESIAIAKENGSWSFLDEVDALVIPEDLEMAFSSYKRSKDYFMSLSNSKKKILLYWIVSAKRDETRQKRIEEIAQQASLEQLPKAFR
ncbi:MAG: YdeI/OmpD-associated family protein [Cytophagales bacterium]|nr:YdeI/OmpD-associated family protein [Cytophagales bacterium]